MRQEFFRAAETLFTAYAIPALLMPFVWLLRRFLSPRRESTRDATESLRRLQASYVPLALGWLVAWGAFRAGIPLERATHAAALAAWIAYAALNVAFARLLMGFTAAYGGVPEGPVKDRLFLGLLSVVVAQPLSTACAFAVLFRIMGVVYHLNVPGLTAVQEGI